MLWLHCHQLGLCRPLKSSLGHLHYMSPDMLPLSFPGEGWELQASPFSLQAFAQKRMMCLLSMQPPARVQPD